MERYMVELKKGVLKDLSILPRKDIRRILAAIQSLADNPRPPQAKKLSGREQYRLRQGDYRILYAIQDDVLVVFVVAVGHRRDLSR